MNFVEVTLSDFRKLLDFWCDNPDKRRSMQPDQYLARTDDWYVVADNRSYEFYVEEFRTLTDALAWLNEC